MRSPITNLVNQFNSLNEAERALFLDLVDPQPEQSIKAPAKRKRTGGKSKQATKLGEQLKTNLSQRDAKDLTCSVPLPNGAGVCNLPEDDVLHRDTSYGNYHPFEAPKAAVASGD